MADEEAAQEDVKVEASAESSPAEKQSEVANPPAEESSAAKETDRRIPYERFSDVVQERNAERERREALEQRLRDVEARLPNGSSQSAGNAEVDRLVKKLGMSEEAAREIVETSRAAARAEGSKRDAQLQAMQLAEWNRSMEQRHKDYLEVVPDMEKLFSRLSPAVQNLVVADPEGLEMLYHRTKAAKVQDSAKQAYDKGAAQAYSKKDEKRAVSSVPGSGSKDLNPEISAEWIRNASIADYKKNLDRVNHWLSTGKQK